MSDLNCEHDDNASHSNTVSPNNMPSNCDMDVIDEGSICD